jgi:magnesium transporter
MAKEFLSVNQDHTIGKIADGLKRLGEEELLSHQFVFVVDSSGRLLGQIPVVRVFILDPNSKAAEVMNPDPVSIEVMEDQEKVAQLFARRDLLSMAVVDTNRRLVGRITVDDVIDVMTEEATEDMARFAGSSEEEFGQTSVKAISRARLPWLMMGLMGELLSALVISRFQAGLQVKVILAFFIPLVMATGGNSGVQTSSNLIRALATGNFDRFRARRHVAREVFVGLLNGFLLGGILVLTLILFRQDPSVGFVIGLSLMCVVVVATSIGTIVPLVLNWMGVDPALATGPFITTSNDVLGLLVYLSLAHKFLGL